MLRGCSARGNARGKAVALLEVVLVARRLGLWRSSLRRQCSWQDGCSVGGGARCKVARLVAFLIASMHSTSTCTKYELTLNMTRVRSSGSHIGFMCRVHGSGPQVGSLSRGHPYGP
ncbi:hypothetical protein DVH24_015002 [Malus domestica]|uniref:Uncharacterized protein n=1 Tax=Malus domestica TaxID=3750 RepID=A0A498K7P0_MALDO|nr:hypothetical protein DVH24_015002 [Malus domestica]